MLRRLLTLMALILLAGFSAGYWFYQSRSDLPAGLVHSNGRVEANQIDIASKYAGRVVEIVPQEGDAVNAGDIVARLDAENIQAQLRSARAEVARSEKLHASAIAAWEIRKTEKALAETELERARSLLKKGYIAREKLDQQQAQFNSAHAAVNSAAAQIEAAASVIDVAKANVESLQTVLNDLEIRAPVSGRIQYRLVEPGAVLAAGQRILTLIDPSDVSMTIFLSAHDAGRLKIGDEARVVLDAAPEFVFPGRISFVAAEAQFTPKTVETASEREKLMFRVKIRAAPEMLAPFRDRVKSGLRGVAYVPVEANVAWPQQLAIKLPQ